MTQGPPGGSPAAPRTPNASVVRYKAELRKAIRRNAMEPEVTFLNIVAMLDIMTIILVFLLKSLGESTATIPQSDDLRLPKSVIQTQPSEEGVVVTRREHRDGDGDGIRVVVEEDRQIRFDHSPEGNLGLHYFRSTTF